MILVFSHPADDHAAGVLRELRRRKHPVTLIDSALFPVQASLTERFSRAGSRVEYGLPGERLALSETARVAWWRRPLPHALDESLDPQVASFAYAECHEAFAGAFALLDVKWVNPPHLDERAHHKPLQLATAVRVGLTIPRTLITNDPADARAFIAEQKGRA